MLYISFAVLIALSFVAFRALNSRKISQLRKRAKGQFVATKRGEVHLLELGSGASDSAPDLVFIHGASCHASDMQLAFRDSFSGYRKIFVDRPGCGYSSPIEFADLSAQAEEIAEALSSFDVKNPIVIAQSYGGALALKIALERKIEIGGLVLLAPVSHRWPGGVDWYNHFALIPVIGVFFRHVIIPIIGKVSGEKIVKQAFWPKEPPEDYFERAEMDLIFGPEAFKANCQAIVSLYDDVQEMEPQYTNLDIPVRIIAGTHDTAVLSTIHGFGLKGKVRDCEIEFVESVGHPVHHFAQCEAERAVLGIINGTNSE